MSTPIVTDPGTTFTDRPYQQVEVSTDITDPEGWTTVPFLWCEEFKPAVNAYSTAKLEYFIGYNLLQPGAADYGDYQPLSLRGKHIRIVTDAIPNGEWVGYVLTDVLQRDGVKEHGIEKFEGEKQVFHCVGLEWWLDRKQVETSRVSKSTDPHYVEIKRALKFNGGESSTIDMKAAHRGNRATSTNDDGYYDFTDDPTTQIRWTAHDIVAHLLVYQTIRNSGGTECPARFAIYDIDNCLAGFHPTIASEHQTVFQLLNKIITPQRGLCWWLEFDDDTGTARVRVASLARTEVALTDSFTLPANPNQETLNFDAELDVKSVTITNQGKRNYHKVTCRGARQTVTFTVGKEDETLEEDWTQGEESAETDYNQGAVAEDGYTDLSDAKKKNRSDAFRKSDLLARVYSYFRIPKDWDGKSGDGGTAEKDYAIAEISTTGSVLGGLPLSVAGIRLLHRTRLKLGVDYSSPSVPTDKTPDGTLEEFLAPFALLKVEEEPEKEGMSNPDRWQYCEKISPTTVKFHAGTAVSSNISTPYHLTMQPHVPGIIVNSTGMQHTMALGAFDAGAPEPSNAKCEVSFNNLRATVCAEADYYASGEYAVDPLPDNVPIEELIIDLGDDYRLDFLAKNTIVNLKDGIPILAGDPGVLRDDRSTLRDVARIAFEWYREDRQQLTVEFRQLRNLFSLGQLITTIGEGTTQTTINTVVSCLTYNFGKAGTLTVETMDDTLDIRALRGGGIT